MLKKCIIAFIAGFLAASLIVFGGPANANRPIPGHNYKDVCKNIKGKQTILDVTGISARYKFDESTPRKNDCVRVVRFK